MLVSLNDATIAKYQAAAAKAKIPLEALLERQLARFGDVPVTERLLVLSGDALEALERQLSGGQLKSPQDLVTRVHRWAGITIGGIRLNFSEAQLEEIAVRATKQGKAPKEIVQDIVRQMEDQFFWTPRVAV